MDEGASEDIQDHWHIPGSLEQGIRDAEALQLDIDDALGAKRGAFSIVLDHGSEVADLASNADVRVRIGDGDVRYFSVISQQWAARLFDVEVTEPDLAHCNEFHAVGHPLIIVKEITGGTIVRSILHYLDLEKHLEGP